MRRIPLRAGGWPRPLCRSQGQGLSRPAAASRFQVRKNIADYPAEDLGPRLGGRLTVRQLGRQPCQRVLPGGAPDGTEVVGQPAELRQAEAQPPFHLHVADSPAQRRGFALRGYRHRKPGPCPFQRPQQIGKTGKLQGRCRLPGQCSASSHESMKYGTGARNNQSAGSRPFLSNQAHPVLSQTCGVQENPESRHCGKCWRH